jgi:signal transduction histidine kinase/CheY-like chemotaxis protein
MEQSMDSSYSAEGGGRESTPAAGLEASARMASMPEMPRELRIEDLFGLEDLQRLQDDFAEATGVGSVIVRPDGTAVTRPSCPRSFCELVHATEAGRAVCFRSASRWPEQGTGEVRACASGGLWDAGAGIEVEGRHVANWLIGQVRNEDQGEEDIRAFAREIGADEERVLAAFRETPAMSKERFGKVAKMLHTLAGQLSAQAYQNVQQARAIQELRRAEEELLVSTDRMATVLDSLEAIVTIADKETHELLFVNEPGRRVFGDVLGRPRWEALQGLEAPAEEGAGEEVGGVREWEFQHKATGRWYECRDCAIQWTDGREVRLEIATDVTARKQAELEKERLESQLFQAQKLESIGQLAGGVAHDFNNMLGVILGYTDLVIDLVESGDPMHDALEEIRKAAERSADLTRQLLGFARKQTIVPRVLDLNATVEGMMKMLRRLIGEQVELTWNAGEGIGPVKVDPSQIDQVLVNLCLNARDALGDGTGTIRIETSAAELGAAACVGREGAAPGSYVRLSLSDNGRGMDEETLAHAFDPFFSTKDASEGAGLGLSTVYGIARQNNGFVDARSEVGRGTVISVFFPRYGDAPRAAEPTAELAASGAGNETILLVEDEASLLNMTKGMLERRGFAVLPAGSPAEAIGLAETHPGRIDLLMTDVIMPDMGGKELSEKICLLRPGVRRLFMSGHTADVLDRHGVLDEGVFFIQKPFTMKTLSAKVVEVLSARPVKKVEGSPA